MSREAAFTFHTRDTESSIEFSRFVREGYLLRVILEISAGRDICNLSGLIQMLINVE